MFSFCFLPLVCLVTIFVTTTSAQRNSDCVVGPHYYRHNQLFPLPNQSQCIKYICWHGRVIKRIEACEVEGECHRVGATFEHRCTRYRCNKIEQGMVSYYQPQIISTQCTDFNGQCRREGERFPFRMHGTFYPSCTCTISHQTIRYRCYSITYPRRVGNVRGQSGNVQTGQWSAIGGISSAGQGRIIEDESDVSLSSSG